MIWLNTLLWGWMWSAWQLSECCRVQSWNTVATIITSDGEKKTLKTKSWQETTNLCNSLGPTSTEWTMSTTVWQKCPNKTRDKWKQKENSGCFKWPMSFMEKDKTKSKPRGMKGEQRKSKEWKQMEKKTWNKGIRNERKNKYQSKEEDKNENKMKQKKQKRKLRDRKWLATIRKEEITKRKKTQAKIKNKRKED